MCSPRETIGLVGAGLMGGAIAGRLLGAGFGVCAWDSDAARLAALVARGAEAADGAADVAARCRRIVLSLPDSGVVAAVLAEMERTLQSGAVILDTSTGEPEDAARIAGRLAARGVGCLDATISGNGGQLGRGEALCMAGGDAATFEHCGDLFAALGGPALLVGVNGDGARMKLVTNLVLGLNRAALAEGLALAEAMGFDAGKTLAMLQSSAAYSRIMEEKGDKMASRDFTPVARLSQHLKDVRLMLRAAEGAGLALPLSEAHRRLLERAEADGLGSLDNSAIIEVLRRPAP